MNRPLTNFSLDLPRRCADASARAYAEATIESGLCHCLSSTYRSPEGIEVSLLAFRGSATLADWLADARIGFANLGIGRVHSGFWTSFSSLLDQVLRLDQRADPAPVVCTGHSKGGAEAVLAAWLIERNGRPVIGVQTFGSPRVGDRAWKNSYNAILRDCTRRWVHEEDIVPRTPPWISGYRHVGHEYFLSSFGGVLVNPSLCYKAASDIWGSFWGYKHAEIEQLSDHPISKYQHHLNTL